MIPDSIRCEIVNLDTRNASALIDGKRYAASIGAWMFYADDSKFFHARDGNIDCIHRSNPRNSSLAEQDLKYPRSAWDKALATPLHIRLAEVWIASQRLWSAGLGPKPGRIIVARSFVRDENELGPTVGFETKDVRTLPAKNPATEGEIVEAGVVPDEIRSCVRQQLNGYVIDLCSVIGVVPKNAEKEVKTFANSVRQLLSSI